MDFSPTELQRDLAAATGEVLAKHCGAEVVREAWHRRASAGVWPALVGLGLPGALVAEDAGGLGLSVSDLLPALVATGRAAVPAPVVETALVTARLLGAAARPELIDSIVAGREIVTVALAGDPVPWTAAATHVLVLDPVAGVARLHPSADLPTEPLATVDGARPLARISEPAAAALPVAPERVADARLAAAMGTAAQLLGLALRQLEMTVAHVTAREQFGVPVGSFQAVKHQLADVLLAVRFAEPAVRAAGLAMDSGRGCAREVALAKTLASDAADLASRVGIQCHGAIGYTDEYDLHLYAKRTWALAAAWGTAAEHRGVYGDLLGLPAAR